MNRRTFVRFSWGTVGFGRSHIRRWESVWERCCKFLVPSVFYEPPQAFKIGNPADFPFGPPTFLVDEKIFVFRDRDKGFAVASAVCTHLGCTVAHFPERPAASTARATAACLAPTAQCSTALPRAPCEWFEVTLARDGKLRVDKDKVVPSNYRLMV